MFINIIKFEIYNLSFIIRVLLFSNRTLIFLHHLVRKFQYLVSISAEILIIGIEISLAYNNCSLIKITMDI